MTETIPPVFVSSDRKLLSTLGFASLSAGAICAVAFAIVHAPVLAALAVAGAAGAFILWSNAVFVNANADVLARGATGIATLLRFEMAIVSQFSAGDPTQPVTKLAILRVLPDDGSAAFTHALGVTRAQAGILVSAPAFYVRYSWDVPRILIVTGAVSADQTVISQGEKDATPGGVV